MERKVRLLAKLISKSSITSIADYTRLGNLLDYYGTEIWDKAFSAAQKQTNTASH